MTASSTSIPEPLLVVNDLAVSFRRERGVIAPAVRGVSFAMFPGQTLALVGESGSGKSVTALSILRLLPTPPALYERGRIFLSSTAGNIDTLTAPDRVLRSIRGGQITMIFQEPMTSLNPVLDVGQQIVEAVLLHQKVSPTQAREIALAAMQRVGIQDAAKRFSAFPHQFSGGMRQRVMIAMALACNPRMLIADEPTTALDVTVQARILDLLSEMKSATGMAVLLITHDLGLVADRADAVCVMYGGRIVEAGPTSQVLASPVHPYTRALLACRPNLSTNGQRLATVQDVMSDPATTRLSSPDGDIFLWWPHHAPPPGSQAHPPTLIRIGLQRWACAWHTDSADPMRATDPPSVVPSPARARA